MSSLKRILRELRQETEHLTVQAPPGPDEPDPRRLGDEELGRLDELVKRERVAAGERIGNGAHGPGANERPDWQCDCGSCTIPTEPLSEEERAELEALLVTARGDAEPWREGER